MSGLPKCFGVLNAAWFANINLQIQGCQTETELQDLVNEAFADISMLEATLQSQLNALGALTSLIINPGDLGAVITWIENFITHFLTPIITPTIVIPEQLAQLAATVADIEAALSEIKSVKFPGLTIPTITIGCTL